MIHSKNVLKYMAFRDDGMYLAIGFRDEILCKRFTVKPHSRRRCTLDTLFLFKVTHNPYDCLNLLEMLHFHVRHVNIRLNNLFDVCLSEKISRILYE